jgi:hypothetical protein
MRSHKLLVWALAAGAALSAAPGLTGCAGEVYLVETAPPPPRQEVAVYRPGFVWVQGHWARSNTGWRWRPGYYERERPNQVYVHGRWERRGNSYIWIEGRWRGRANVTIRDR